MIWAAFLVLTALHIYANVRAMRALCLKTLNCARMDVLLEHLLMHQVTAPASLFCLSVCRRQAPLLLVHHTGWQIRVST